MIQTLEEKIELLENSNIRTVNKTDVPHPSSMIDLMSKFGTFKTISIGSNIQGKDDNGEEIKLINNYILETKISDVNSEFFGCIGLYINQNSNKAQIYSGLNAHMCLNLALFGADYVKLLKGIEIKHVEALLNQAEKNLKKQIPLILENVERLKEKTYTDVEFIDKKGLLLSTMDSSLFPYILHAENEFRNETGLYYDMPPSDWKLLSAMNDKIRSESSANRIKKTLQLEALFA